MLTDHAVWRRHCFVCRRAVTPADLAATEGRPVAGVCAECARQEAVLRAVPGALGFFFPGVRFTFHRRSAAGGGRDLSGGLAAEAAWMPWPGSYPGGMPGR